MCVRACVCVCVCVWSCTCIAFINILAPSVFHQNVCFRQNERRGEKARGRDREKPCCIPISPAHWGRTVPKILGLRWSTLRPPISNSQPPQSNAIQIITTNGVKLDGYVQHAELFQYAVWPLHIKVVTSGNVKGVECRLSWAREDFYVILQLSYQSNHEVRLHLRLESYLP